MNIRKSTSLTASYIPVYLNQLKYPDGYFVLHRGAILGQKQVSSFLTVSKDRERHPASLSLGGESILVFTIVPVLQIHPKKY